MSKIVTNVGIKLQGVSLVTRLLSYIEVRGPDVCWPWRPKGRKGRYALIRIGNGKKLGAHRVMWELFVGPLAAGICVCHKCDDGF